MFHSWNCTLIADATLSTWMNLMKSKVLFVGLVFDILLLRDVAMEHEVPVSVPLKKFAFIGIGRIQKSAVQILHWGFFEPCPAICICTVLQFFLCSLWCDRALQFSDLTYFSVEFFRWLLFLNRNVVTIASKIFASWFCVWKWFNPPQLVFEFYCCLMMFSKYSIASTV